MLPENNLNSTRNIGFKQNELRFLIVEDHPVYLEGLMFALESLAETVQIQSVPGLQAAKEELSQNTHYDLILLDLHLSDGQGLSLLHYLEIHKLFIPVAVLSGSEEKQDISDAMSAGAMGYISKANGKSKIIGAIQSILAGHTCLPSFYEAPMESERVPIPTLTPRQYEVLQLLAEGLPNKLISRQLGLTEHTVKTHIKTLFQLFEVHNRTECASVAADMGLIEKQPG